MIKRTQGLGDSRMDGRAWAGVAGYFAIVTIVSGMAFFMLDINTHLTPQELPTIVKETATKEGCNDEK